MGGISERRFTVEGFKRPQTTDFRVSDALDTEISSPAITIPHQLKQAVVSYTTTKIAQDISEACEKSKRNPTCRAFPA